MNPAYLEDASGYRGQADALYIPESEPELQAILREANEKRIPVTIAGAGTGLTASFTARAEGDLDGDGTTSLFERVASVATSGEVQGGGAVFELDPLE